MARKKHAPAASEAQETVVAPPEPEAQPAQESAPEPAPKTSKLPPLADVQAKLKRYSRIYWLKKGLTVPATVVLLLIVLASVPLTRYTLIGFVARQDAVVEVVDSRSGTPVSKALVQVAGQTVTTDGSGRARLHINTGYQSLTVTKQYYQTYSGGQLVSLAAADNRFTVKLVAVGRVVPVTVTNKLTGKPVAGATVKALNAEAATDADGTATIVLPVSATTEQVTITAKNFNTLSGTLQVTDRQVRANEYALAPAGKIYFLSNLSGKIDVVKTDLDGTNRTVVVPGTGNEDPYSTALLASRDWKYLAFYTQRKATGGPEIDLIDTSSGELSNIDEGNASFSLVGWQGDKFVYSVNRSNVSPWQNGQVAVKSFDATTKKLTTLVQTTASGSQYDYVRQYFGGVYLLNDKVVYSLNWTAYYYSFGLLAGKQATLNAINLDGSSKTVLQSFALAPGTDATDVSINTAAYDEPNSIAVEFFDGQNNNFYEYTGGKLAKATDINEQNFSSRNYPTFLLSPSGKQTFWSVYADGKNNLNIGDADGQHAQTIATESDYGPYGWFTDDYILLQKSSSELYVQASDGSGQPYKISNYYKPNTNYPGYGGGYGGL